MITKRKKMTVRKAREIPTLKQFEEKEEEEEISKAVTKEVKDAFRGN